MFFPTIGHGHFPRFAVLMIVMGALAPAARAGAPMVSCDHPFVFSNAKVNAVILPYTYSGEAERPLSVAAQKLSGLIYLNTLFSLLKFQSIGAVQLTASEPAERARCTDKVVLNKLIGKSPGAQAQLRPGGGLVIIWGRLYEEGDDIYVQSYVRFLRRDVAEEIQFKAGKQIFRAALVSQAIAFPPRKLSIADLNHIAEEDKRSSGIRNVPDLNAPSRPLPVSTSPYDPPFGYSITEIRGDWMKVVPFEPEYPGGWVLGRFKDSEWSLTRKIPEIDYLEALTGYLMYRSTPTADAAAIARAFHNYDTLVIGQNSDIATAVEFQIQGIVNTLDAGRSLFVVPRELKLDDRVWEPVDPWRRAADLIPDSGEAKNMDICGEIWLKMWSEETGFSVGTHWFVPDYEGLVSELLVATALDPENVRVLGNLQSLYERMLQRHVGSKGEITQKRDAVKRIRTALANQSGNETHGPTTQ
jgi:hypothetical protein